MIMRGEVEWVGGRNKKVLTRKYIDCMEKEDKGQAGSAAQWKRQVRKLRGEVFDSVV